MNTMKVWKINGIELELDMEDADVVERYENAFDKMSAEESTVPKDGKVSVRIRAYCQLFRNLYDRIFGEGTSAKIFAGIPTSCAAYDEVYESFLTFVSAQKLSADEHRNEILAKFRPNRAQRRAKK